jgi:hypothetical protein
MVRAYHLTADTLRDGRPIPPIGVALIHDGPVVICETGLHASERLIDALRYTPQDATWLHVVECDNIVGRQNDKLVCRHRTIVASYPLRIESLRVLAGECAALACWSARLTDDVYQRAAMATTAYRLGEIGAETLRAQWAAAKVAAKVAAEAAAKAAAKVAAEAAARAAARAAAEAAAEAAAWAAAEAAAEAAARAAARDAAGAVAWAAARAAAGAAAWDAAWDAARAAAWDAAWDAAGDAAESRAVAILTGGAR